jgi:hypothetical protein
MNTNSELQELIDICFDLALTALGNTEYFKDKSMEEKAKWVSCQLANCGFKTIPIGACWGSLINDK